MFLDWLEELETYEELNDDELVDIVYKERG
jgi:hypothetical protein